jgi:hypothetical protein
VKLVVMAGKSLFSMPVKGPFAYRGLFLEVGENQEQ